MNEEMKKTTPSIDVMTLVEKAVNTHSSEEAVQFSTAACNCISALMMVQDFKIRQTYPQGDAMN